MAFIPNEDYDAWQEDKRRLAASRQEPVETPAMPRAWQQGYQSAWTPGPEIGASQPLGASRTLPYTPPPPEATPMPVPMPSSWQQPEGTFDQPSTPPAVTLLGADRFNQPTIPMPTRPVRPEIVDRDLPDPAEAAGAMWTGVQRYGIAPVSGLATETVGGPAQAEYERRMGLPGAQPFSGDAGQWWSGLGERQLQRQEAGVPNIPLGDVLPFTPGEYAGIGRAVGMAARGVPVEAAAAARQIAPAIRQGTEAVAGKVAEVAPAVREALASERGAVTLPNVVRPAEGQPRQQASATRRFYHGTGSAFESPDVARFDPNGLRGPGYYLTSNPEVAGSYATQRASDAAAQEFVGPNVRAVNVPEDLRLYPANETEVTPDIISQIADALPQGQNNSFAIQTNNARWENPRSILTGERAYDILVQATNSKAQANAALANAGFDGLTYPGGRHMPLLDAQGKAIEHQAVVVFPDSLPKITNAISGRPMGVAPEAAGAVGGAVAYQDDPNLTPQENMQRRALYAVGGALGAHGITRVAASPAVQAAAKRVGEGAMAFARDIGSERGELSLGGATTEVAQTPHMARLETALAAYSPMENKVRALEERLGEIEGELSMHRELSAASSGVQRPPNRIGWTDADLAAFAQQHGVNPYENAWWEHLDPEAWAEMGPRTRSGPSVGGKTAKIEALQAERNRVQAELQSARPELAKLEAELNSAWVHANNVEGTSAINSVLPPDTGGPVGELKMQQEGVASKTRRMIERAKRVPYVPQKDYVPGWRDPAAMQQAERATAEAQASAPGRRPPPEPPKAPPASEWMPQEKPLTNPAPPQPAADPYTQLVDALTPAKRTPREVVELAGDKFLRAMYDKTWDAKTIEAATGIPVHKLAQIVPGSIAYGEFLVEQQVMPVLRSVGKDVLYLEQYMVARRFEDILARNPWAKLPGGVQGWVGQFKALDTLKQKVGPERFAAIEDAARKMWQLNDELVLKPRLEAGLLSKEQYTAIKAVNPHYISFYREDFTGLQTGFNKGGGPANVTNAGIDAMDLGGSNRRLNNPLARFNAQVINSQHLIAENKAARAIVDGLMEMEKAGAAKGAAKVSLPSGERFVRLLKPGEAAEHSKVWDTVSYLDDGKKITAQVPAQFAAMAKGLEAESVNFWSRLARAASFPLRAGAVTYNVAFIPKNVIRDLNSAFFREGLQPISGSYAEGWMAAIAKNSDYADAAKAGVLMSGIVENMRSTNALARAVRPGGITVASPKDALLLLPRIIRAGAASIERTAMVSEQATRIATYSKLRGQGVGQLEAAVRARDVTVDFAKAGNIMKVINQAIPFSNAGLQGAANTMRTIRYNPKQAIIGASPFAALTVLAYANNQRYETAHLIPEREYAMNWVFQFGEGTKAPDPKFPNKPPEKFPIYIRIPKGSIAGMLTAPIEMALRYAWANDDRSVLNDLWSTLGTAGSSLSPVEPSLTGVLPPLVSTAQGLQSNYDAFRGQPIVPRSEQDRPPELQFGAETSREAVAIGERFHVSPRMIDWAIKDAGAGVGSQTLWLSDLILGAVGYNPTAFGEARKQPLSGPQELAKMPITGGFVGVQGSELANRGWDAFDKAVQDSQRAAAAVPEMRRLGITIGPVSDKASVGDFSVVLAPQERADLQQLTTQVMLGLVPKITESANYQRAPLALQAKALQAVLDKGREAAREAYLRRIPKNDLERRVSESLPVPVGR